MSGGRPEPRSRGLRRLPLVGTLAVGAVCAAAGAVHVGTDGLAAAALAAGLVVAFFATGSVPVHLADAFRLRAGTGVVLLVLTYVLRWLLVVAVLALVATGDLVHDRTLGLTVIVCGLAWLSLQAAVVIGGSRGT